MSFRVKPEIIFIIEKGQPPQEENESIFPPMDIYHSQGALHVEIEMPGVDPQEVKISLRGKELIVEGTKRDTETPPLPLSFLRMERFMGPFKKTIRLPHPVDSQGVRASFRKGVLYIQIPIKREEYTVEIEQED